MSRKPFVLPFRVALAACMAITAVVLLPQGSLVFGGTYQPCRLPVVVGATVRPNVMIVQDMSGSMQAAAYYNSGLGGQYFSNTRRAWQDQFGISSLAGLTAYQMSRGYYGSADTDTYYSYNATGNSTGGYFQPVDSSSTLPHLVQFTDVSQDGGSGTSIKFTAAGHGLSVGDWAAFYNLSSHKGMNGDAYQVTAVSGNTFTVSAQWSGSADTIQGQVIKRVVSGTSLITGLNGTVLNFLLTTRTDAAMKAFIGGRAAASDTIPDPDDSTKTITRHYLQYQGQRRFVADETLGCLAYIRPGIATASPTSPDSYTTGTYYGVLGSATDPSKDMYMTVSDFWKGTLNSGNPSAKKKVDTGSGSTSTAGPAQVYSFTLTAAATVTIRMFATNNNFNTYVNLYSGSTPTSGGHITYDNGTTSPTSTNDGCAVITRSLAAGTYCIEATCNDYRFYGTYYVAVTLEEGSTAARGSDPNITLVKDTTDTDHNGVLFTSTVGRILNAQCRVQQPDSKRAGVVQNSFSLVRFGFTYYNSGSKPGNYGRILVGCDNTSLDTLIHAMSGIGSQTVNSTTIDFTQCYPYYGTPTGQGLQVAYNYFSQTNFYTQSGNDSNPNYTDYYLYTNPAFYPRTPPSITDPYYGPELDSSGNPQAVPCRKSFVLLISDGEYSGGTVEPTEPALKMHATDIRSGSAFPLTQNVTVYSIFAFSSTTSGVNSMKAIAMFGAFTDVTVGSCGGTGLPYTASGTPSDSKNFAWDRTDCNPSGTYIAACCKEWDAVWTREGEVTNSQKGVPDTYFEASDGKQLEDSLSKVLEQVLSANASASAVATVSQQLSTGDTIIRGVFEASDPEQLERFLWYGHLEAYWSFPYPNSDSTTVKYDFELPCNSGLRCEEMPHPSCGYDDAHCWDGGQMLKDRIVTTVGDPRWVFTATYDSATNKWSNLDFSTANLTLGTITPAMLGLSGSDAATDAEKLIRWTLGEYVAGLRLRADKATDDQRKLGDIVYSTPVVGGPPSPGAVSPNDPNISTFYKYRNQTFSPSGCTESSDHQICYDVTQDPPYEILYRDKVVYVGANDGMLHAFLLARWDGDERRWLDQPGTYTAGDRKSPNIGKEIWAYIPSNLMKKLQFLSQTTYGSSSAGGCAHRAMVDLSEQVFEVYMHRPASPARPGIPAIGAGTTREWRSVLIGGERGGGDTYFAIDVTNPYNPIVLWEYSVLKDRVVLDSGKAYQPFGNAYDSICDFPMTWTQPALGRLQLPEVDFYTGTPSSAGLVIGAATKEKFTGDLANRHVVFVGGGLRLFDKSFATTPPTPSPYTDPQWAAFKEDLFKPSLIVLDIETGHNLFKYIWPTVVAKGNSASFSPTVWPQVTRGSNTVPYAMNDPVAIDIWNPVTAQPSDDGFTDRVYIGDTNGLFYGVKFTSGIASTPGFEVNVWRTKTITDAAQLASNIYRGSRQPITQSPSISFETPQTGVAPNLRVIFAAGKYEDVVGSSDDKTDLIRTSLYNLQDSAAGPTLPGSATNVLITGYYFSIVPKCTTTNFNTSCTWTKSGGIADCCQSSCASPCYKCVFDLTQPTDATQPGERFVAKPLIAGGLVFATSFLPSLSPCDYTGTGYLYIFDYQCELFDAGFNPLTDETPITSYTTLTVGSGSGTTYGVQLSLGVGMPSRAVLSSDAKNVIVQMSDGTLHKIPVKLPKKPIQLQGWQEK